MSRFARERAEMVELLRERGITDDTILRAMGKIERHLFVPEPFTTRSYEDSALPIANGQTISQPYTVAYMTQALSVKEGDKVLEVGTGSGYQASILAEMGARVYTIERDLELLAGARKIVERLGYRIASKGGRWHGGLERIRAVQRNHRYGGRARNPHAAPQATRRRGQDRDPRWRYGNPVARRCHPPGGERFDRRVYEGFKFVPLVGKMGWSH